MSSDGLNSKLLSGHFSALLQSADLAIIGITPDGTVTVWNRQAEDLFGYSADEMMGTPFSLLIPPQYANQDRVVLEALQHADRIQDVITQRLHKSGQPVDVYLTYSAVRDPVSGIGGVLVIARNLEESKRLEKAERDQLFLSAIVSSADAAITSKPLEAVVTSWKRAAESP